MTSAEEKIAVGDGLECVGSGREQPKSYYLESAGTLWPVAQKTTTFVRLSSYKFKILKSFQIHFKGSRINIPIFLQIILEINYYLEKGDNLLKNFKTEN